MKNLLEKNSYKKLALYNKGFINTSKEDWINYREDYFKHGHLLDSDYFTSEAIIINVTDNFSVQLPHEMKELGEEIEKSINFLENSDEWDPDEGELFNSATLKSAIKFLTDYAFWVYDKQGFVIPIPKIYPGPDGSIDLLWKKDQYKLLVNIKPYPKTFATFYGKSDGEEFIEGKFNLGNINQTIFLVLFERQKHV